MTSKQSGQSLIKMTNMNEQQESIIPKNTTDIENSPIRSNRLQSARRNQNKQQQMEEQRLRTLSIPKVSVSNINQNSKGVVGVQKDAQFYFQSLPNDQGTEIDRIFSNQGSEIRFDQDQIMGLGFGQNTQRQNLQTASNMMMGLNRSRGRQQHSYCFNDSIQLSPTQKNPNNSYSRVLMSHRFSNQRIQKEIVQNAGLYETKNYNNGDYHNGLLKSNRDSIKFENFRILDQNMEKRKITCNAPQHQQQYNVAPNNIRLSKNKNIHMRQLSETMVLTEIPKPNVFYTNKNKTDKIYNSNKPASLSDLLQTSDRNDKTTQNKANGLNQNEKQVQEIEGKIISNSAFNIIQSTGNQQSQRNQGQVTYRVVSPCSQSQNHIFNNESVNQFDDSNPSNLRRNQLVTPQSQLDLNLNGYYNFYNQISMERQQKLLIDQNINDEIFQYLVKKKISPKVFTIKNPITDADQSQIIIGLGSSSQIEVQKLLYNDKIQFNPSNLEQWEIFLIKAVDYLEDKDWQNASLFIEKAQKLYPEHYYKFRFNQGLLYILTENYKRAIKAYIQILKDIMSSKNQSDILNIITKRDQQFKAVILNLLISMAYCREEQPTNWSFDSNLEQVIKEYQRLRVRLYCDSEDQNIISLIDFITNGYQDPEDDSKKSNIIKNSPKNEASQNNEQILTFRGFRQSKKHNRVSSVNMVQQHAQPELNFNQTLQSANYQCQEKKQLYKSIIQKRINKVRFDKIGNQVGRPSNLDDNKEQILTMEQIVARLKQGSIQNNNKLKQQIKDLDEQQNQDPIKGRLSATKLLGQMKQERGRKQLDDEFENGVLAFPYQKSENQIQKRKSKAIKQVSKINDCIRSLQELEIEITIENGGNFDKFDPVKSYYKSLCNSISALCQEEDLFDILRQEMQQRKNNKIKIIDAARGYHRQGKSAGGSISSIEFLNTSQDLPKYSAPRDILISSLLKIIKQSNIDLNATDIIEINSLKNKVEQLKELLMGELMQHKIRKEIQVQDQGDLNIKRMLISARKKQRERERLEKSPMQTGKNGLPSLQLLLQDPQNLEQIAKAFKIEREKYCAGMAQVVSLTKRNQEEANTKKQEENEESEMSMTGNNQINQILRNIVQTTVTEVDKFGYYTEEFLDYLFLTYGSFFVSQKTYCMDSFFKDAPPQILKYAENVSNLLCSIPLRFPILTDEINDVDYQDLQQQEFVWNKQSLLQRFVSQSLRYQRNLDYLGNYKTDWIIEVIQKYNFLAILVQMMREGINHYSPNKHKNNENETAEQLHSTNLDGHKFDDQNNESFKSSARGSFINDDVTSPDILKKEPLFQSETLKLVREQYAKLKFSSASSAHQTFNTMLVDKLIGAKLPMLRQFDYDMRAKIYRILHYKSKPSGTYLSANNYELNPQTTMLITSGYAVIQGFQKDKIDSFDINVPQGQQEWKNIQVMYPGDTIPIKFLFQLRHTYEDVRVLLKKNESILYKSDPFKDFEYFEFSNDQISDVVYRDIKQSILRKAITLQGIDIFGGVQKMPMGAQQNQNKRSNVDDMPKVEAISPYILIVMAILCKVQVFKFSEQVVKQDQIPKCMLVILEGHATSILNHNNGLDNLKEKYSSQYSPTSDRGASVPSKQYKSLHWKDDTFSQSTMGLKKTVYGGGHANFLPKTTRNKYNRKSSSRFFTIKDISSQALIDKHELHKNKEIHKGFGTATGRTKQKLVALQKGVKIDKDTANDCQNTKQEEQIEFQTLQEGAYVASRILLDESNVRIFIRKHQQQEGSQNCSIDIDSQWQTPFKKIQEDDIENQEDTPGGQNLLKENRKSIVQAFNIDENQDSINQNQICFEVIPPVLKDRKASQIQNRKPLLLSLLNKHQYKSSMNQQEQQQKQSLDFASAIAKAKDQEYQQQRHLLLSSQLSIVAKSSQLKMIAIYKHDKVYFCETIKKLLDERVGEKGYFDQGDRPMRDQQEMEKVKSNAKEWALYKQGVELECLQQAYSRQ